MGDQVRCTVQLGEVESEGTAHLETETLVFRGTFRLAVRFADVSSVSAGSERLSVTWPGGPEGGAAFRLGPKAQRWARAIRDPKPVIDKLGVSPGMRVALGGVDDVGFRAQLAGRSADGTTGTPLGACDHIFLGAPHRSRLALSEASPGRRSQRGRADGGNLASLQRHMEPDGALWVLRPKGSPDITEAEVLDAGRRHSRPLGLRFAASPRGLAEAGSSTRRWSPSPAPTRPRSS